MNTMHGVLLVGLGVAVGYALSRRLPQRNPQFRHVTDPRTGRTWLAPLRLDRDDTPPGYDYDWRQSSTDRAQATARRRGGRGVTAQGGRVCATVVPTRIVRRRDRRGRLRRGPASRQEGLRAA